MKVVLDTNIFISGIFWLGNPYKLLNLWRKGNFELVVSRQIIKELISVLKRFKMPEEDIDGWEDTIIKNSILIEPEGKIDIIEDEADNRFLECAVGCKADYIVSGDSHLLKLEEYQGIKIIKAKEMLEILEGVEEE